MEQIFIKYFSIIFWSLFIFIKILNQKYTIKTVLIQIFYSVLLALIILGIRMVLPEFISIVIVCFSFVLNLALLKRNIKTIFISTFISSGMSYAIHTISGVVLAIILTILSVSDNENLTSLFILSFFMVGLMTFLLFKIKRFKSGFLFLNKENINTIGFLLSAIIFVSYAVITSVVNRFQKQEAFYIVIPLGTLSILICSVMIVIWWRKGLTKTYKDCLKEREIEYLNTLIIEKDEYISELIKNNDALSSIIHRDNKLISALELRVNGFISDTLKNNPEFSEEGENVLRQLRIFSNERAELLNQYKKETKKLPCSGISSLDTVLNYILYRANELNVEFDVLFSDDVKFMTLNLISEKNLSTLTADLLENALIAVKNCKCKRILFTIGLTGDFYEINIYDSGIYFNSDVLKNLGKKRITTYKNSGGNGIGMMTAFEILIETNASLIIDEQIKNFNPFIKRITVRFDGLNNYIYNSHEQKESESAVYNILQA